MGVEFYSSAGKNKRGRHQMFTVKYNKTSNHISGIEARTEGSDLNYAASACGSLSRSGHRMAVAKSYDSVADALKAIQTSTRSACKNCVAAAEALIAAEAEKEEEVQEEVTETETPATDSETLVTVAVMAPGSTSTKRETVSLPGGLSDWDAETTARRMLQGTGWNVMEMKEIRRR
jgi:hypothetical protein